jgi:hypothetical protein
MKRILALVSGAVCLGFGATVAFGAAGGVPPIHQRVSVDFTIPDICTFPIRVHTEGFMIDTSQGEVFKTTATLGNADLSRTLIQQNHSVVHDLATGDGYADVYFERIVLPGEGLVYGTMGRVVFHFDGEGNFIGSEFFGHTDPYSTYTSVVCGYLAG